MSRERFSKNYSSQRLQEISDYENSECETLWVKRGSLDYYEKLRFGWRTSKELGNEMVEMNRIIV